MEKEPRLPAESAAAAVMSGTAVTSDSTVSMPSPTRSGATPSAGAPKRTARPWIAAEGLSGRGDVSLGRMARIEPCAVHPKARRRRRR